MNVWIKKAIISRIEKLDLLQEMWFAWIEVGLLASAVQTLFDRNLLGAVRTTKSIYLTLKPADSLEAEK